MIYTVTGWSEITQYNDNIEISIANLVENTWMYRYPRPKEITYDQGSDFIGHEFRKFLIQMEYRIISKPSTSGNPMFNAILEHICQLLGNLVRTCNITQHYADGDDPWTGILAAAAFVVRSTTNRLKVYSPGQLIFWP